jgi:hypothetical protein
MAEMNEKGAIAPTPDRDVESSPPQAADIKARLESSSIAPPPVGVEKIITKNGLRLHPQPTSDALDPLNWTSFQKHGILAIIMFFYFMFT